MLALVLCTVAQSLSDSVLLLCPWGFSRQEYWSGFPCLPPRDLPDPGIEPRFPALEADSLPIEPSGNLISISIYSLLKYN